MDYIIFMDVSHLTKTLSKYGFVVIFFHENGVDLSLKTFPASFIDSHFLLLSNLKKNSEFGMIKSKKNQSRQKDVKNCLPIIEDPEPSQVQTSKKHHLLGINNNWNSHKAVDKTSDKTCLNMPNFHKRYMKVKQEKLPKYFGKDKVGQLFYLMRQN